MRLMKGIPVDTLHGMQGTARRAIWCARVRPFEKRDVPRPRPAQRGRGRVQEYLGPLRRVVRRCPHQTVPRPDGLEQVNTTTCQDSRRTPGLLSLRLDGV